jgi:hypothetical protein
MNVQISILHELHEISLFHFVKGDIFLRRLFIGF